VVADLITARLERGRLLTILQELYGRTPEPLPPICEVLRSIPFASVVTASWGDLIERMFAERIAGSTDAVISIGDSRDFTERFRQITNPSFFTIVKIYGTLSGLNTFVFTADEYTRALQENLDLAKFLSSLFTSNTLFFVGVSLASVEQFLSGSGLSAPSARRHFAVVPWQRDIESQKERFLSRWGVELLVFVPSQGYAEVREFCKSLRDRVRARTRIPHRQRLSPTQISPATLDRVTLSNIGPFDQLTLDFNHTWNVILGDNGSGKSTVLKAIGLGLCGDEERAVALAAPLLRRADDVTAGYVELTVGDRIYRTDLVKIGDRVQVRSRQLTPLQAGTWPVVGFPPLRGASTRDLRGPYLESQPPYPVVDDLLPILAGAVDYRFDDVKQWIVNTLFQRREGGENSPIPVERNRRQIETIFLLVAALTPGLRLEFSEVTSSYQVLVRTDDGVVPISQLSQGMSSIFGWIGTLLRRMYAIYPLSEHPKDEPALVLIDEIDAHLHPQWQRTVVPAIRKQFPRLQIIATTHSPLILPSLEPNEIIRLRRDPATKRIEAAITNYDVQDYRTD
jgi:energy-coupling factor transporter ATP-binding protein EcfA2